MKRLVDCQFCLLSCGSRPYFRRAKVGLVRRGQAVYLVALSQSKLGGPNKFLVDRSSLEVLPAVLRLRTLKKDLLIREVEDAELWDRILRQIKVILNGDKLKQNGKELALQKLLASIPTLDSLSASELRLAPVSVSLGASEPDKQQAIVLHDTVGYHHSQNGLSPNGLHHHHQTKPPVSVVAIDNLKQLDNKQLKNIKICHLGSVPRQLWQRTSLQELTLTGCNLTRVPPQLEQFASTLECLDLSNNKIAQLPRRFCCHMNQLQVLHLNQNSIEVLPIEIKFLSRLVELNISENRLRMLPSTFSNLGRLRKLNVANNRLSQLPAFRTDEIRLRYLDVSNNPLDGALNKSNVFQVYPSTTAPYHHSADDDAIRYIENPFCSLTNAPISKKRHFPKLFETTMLKIVRCDRLLKLASRESLPETIVSTMQRDIFKCYKCGTMDLLPAYNSTDRLDYVHQVEQLVSTGNYNHGMTFMKLICSSCFDKMSS